MNEAIMQLRSWDRAVQVRPEARDAPAQSLPAETGDGQPGGFG